MESEKYYFFLSWPYGSGLNGEQQQNWYTLTLNSLAHLHVHIYDEYTHTQTHTHINSDKVVASASIPPEWKAIYRCNVICNFDTHFAKWFWNDALMNSCVQNTHTQRLTETKRRLHRKWRRNTTNKTCAVDIAY